MFTRTTPDVLNRSAAPVLVASSRLRPEATFGTYAERQGHQGNLDPMIQKPASRW